MKIEFTGRQTGVPDEVRRLAERKLSKVGKLLPSLTRAHVILSADKHRQVAEVSVHSRRLDLAAVEVTTDLRLSVSGAIEKLLRQAQRQRAKRRERKGAASPRLTPVAPEPGGDGRVPRVVRARGGGGGAPGPGGHGRVPRVVRSRRVAVRPMTLEEAALEMGSRADGVLVFRDRATERMGVLFRRRDGSLGLIEPEA